MAEQSARVIADHGSPSQRQRSGFEPLSFSWDGRRAWRAPSGMPALLLTGLRPAPHPYRDANPYPGSPGDERAQVQRPDHDEQEPVAGDQREVLQRAAEHRAEQVGRERRRRTTPRPRKRCAKIRLAMKIGANAIAAAGQEPRHAASRLSSDVVRHQPGGGQRTRPARRRARPGGGSRTAGATSIAARTLSSTPAKTSEFTNQVVPNSSANWTTFLVSSSRNAAPMKDRST